MNVSLNTKNNAFIQFDETIDIKDIYDGIDDLNKIYIYKLWATVEHFGDVEKGHYVTNIKVDNLWFKFNDDEINNININLCSSSVIMLLYKRMLNN